MEVTAEAVEEQAEALLAGGNLGAAIDVRRRALDAWRERNSSRIAQGDWEAVLINLGVDLSELYRRTGSIAALEESLRLGEQALKLAAPAEHSTAACNLASRLAVLARRPGQEAALRKARQLLEHELSRPEVAKGDQRARVVAVLAGILLQQFQQDGSSEPLSAGRRLLDGPDGEGEPAPQGSLVSNITGLLLELAEQEADVGSLSRAETLLRTALADATGPEPVLTRNLMSVLLTRFDWSGDVPLLQEAVELGSIADILSEGVEVPRLLSIRAVARATRARRLGRRDLLDEALRDAESALTSASSYPHEDIAEYSNHVAMLLAERYDLFGDSEDLDRAIQIFDGALAADPDADAFPALASNASSALLSRFERDEPEGTASRGDLERSADLAEQAVSRTPGGLHRPARLDAAGHARGALAHHFNSGDDAMLAEQHARDAVDATPQSSPDRALYLNNWARWVTDRYERTDEQAALEEAIVLLHRALAIAAPNEDDKAGPSDHDLPPADRALTATIRFNLGARLQELFEIGRERGREDWEILQEAADQLDDVMDCGLPHLILPAGKRLGDIAWRVSLWPEAEHSFRLALAAAGELAGLRGSRLDKERARRGVQGIGALAALCAARAGQPEAAAVHIEQASATLIAEALGVRAATITFDEIADSARRMGRSILMLCAAPPGGLAVVMGPDGAVGHRELPDLTDRAVAEQTARFRARLADEDGSSTGDDPAEAAAADLAAWTYRTVIAPLLPLLEGVSGLALLSLGQLNWLPLTTAADTSGATPLADHGCVMLLRAAISQPEGTPGWSSGPRRPERVVVLASAGSSDRPIPGAIDEASRVAACYPDAQVHTTLTSSDRLDEMMAADIVHLACHIDVDIDNPANTIVHLDPELRLSDLERPRSGHAHIVLSACEAALTANSLPDEALSVATSFLLAGADQVTAPLWPVDDDVTPDLMVGYHQKLARGVEAPSALAELLGERRGELGMLERAAWVVTAWPWSVLATDDEIVESEDVSEQDRPGGRMIGT